MSFSPSRVALGYIALSVVALALFAIPLWYGFQANLGTFRAYVPGAEMQRLVELFHRDGAQAVSAAVETYLPSLPRDEVIVFADPDKRRLAGNLPAWPAEVPDVPGTYGLVIGLGGETSMRVVTSHVSLPGGYSLLMGRESVRFESLVERFWYGVAGAMAVVLALGAGLAWLLRRSLLADVREISRSATAIMDGDLSRRLPLRGGSSELDALAQTVNGMLAQLAVINASEEGFWDWSVATDEFYASPRLLEIYGFPPGTTFSGRKDFLARFAFHPEDRPKWEQAASEHFAGKTARCDIEMRMLRGGETRWLHLTGLATRNAAGQVTRWTGATRDITERKRAEALLAGEKRLLEGLARGSPLPALLEQICRLFDEVSPGLVSTIMLLEGERMRLGAAPNLPPSYSGHMADLPLAGPQAGLCALAVARRASVVASDLASDPAAEGFRDLYLAHGLRALWSTPFMSEAGLPLGTFAIFARQPGSPTVQQLGLIEQFTHIASIAVERKRNEEALRLSEERYARAMAASNDGLWEWCPASDEMFVSPRARQLFGIADDAVIRTRADVKAQASFHPDDLPRIEAATQARRASESGGLDIEYRVVASGEIRWIRSRGKVFLDAQGRPALLTGALTDITERKRAEQALSMSEQRYERAMLASEAGYWDWDVSTDEFYASPKLLEMGGYPPGTKFAGRADFVQRSPFHPDDRASWQGAVKEFFAGTRQRLAMEVRVIVGGEIRWHHLNGICIRDAAGKVLRWSGSSTDVTARKRAEEALRISEERYARAMEGSDAGHWDWNIVTDEMFVSPRAREMLSLPPGALPARRADIMALVPQHADDRAAMNSRVNAGIPSGIHERDYRIIPRPGETRWLRSRGKVYKDASGAAVRMTGSLTDITERKLATDALRASEERYALAMEVAEEGHLDWNAQTDEFFASAQAKRIMNVPQDAEYRTRDDVMGHVPYHPDDRPRVSAAWRDSLAARGTQHELEYRILRGEEIRWIRAQWKIIRGADGMAQRVIGVVSDITERKLAADELRESEARFRALTELSSDWYWRQDENLRFTYASHQGADPASYPREWVIGKTRWELPGITPLSFTWAEHQAALAARQPFRDLEYGRVARDGRMEYVSISGAPVFDENGHYRGYQGIGRNITERKRIEEELRSRQEMLELAQTSARVVAFEWRIGADGPYRNRWSRELAAMYGVAPEAYDGSFEQWKKLIHPEDRPAVRGAIKHALRTGDVATEYRVVHADGSVHWLHAKGRMFFDAAGKPARMLGFMHDVTEKHEAEEELRSLERQLRQAQRLEAMGTLAGGIAHDFNNILGAILGYGEMALRDAPKSSRLRRDLDSIIVAGERGRALVDRVLAFSRSGVADRVPVHVEKLVREALDLVSAKLPPSVTLHAKLHAGCAAVLGDPTQVHQVLMNLATNAIQSMPDGGTLRVHLDALRIDTQRVAAIGMLSAADYVVLKVTDTGTGIAPDVMERIFDPFFTTKEAGTGTGLGLSLVHGIVSDLGGAIDVASTVGAGTAFTVYLPRSGDAVDQSEDEETEMPRGEGQRVLVVDDEEPLVQLATRTLEELGYAPVGFTSSTAALAAFRADPKRFDAVITDERMPGLSGSALIREVRGIRGSIPIVLMSGYVGAAVARQAREAGAEEVLKKPLSVRDLAASLARVLLPSPPA